MKKENRIAVHQAVLRDELNQRIQYAAVTPIKEL